jgi:hypothetical protein
MRRVERVKRVIWQCESEIILDAVGVEKDIGKLVAGAADHKLLVAGLPSRDLKNWLEFIAWAGASASGEFFIALMDSYSGRSRTGSARWKDRTVSLQLYYRQNGFLREADGPIRL